VVPVRGLAAQACMGAKNAGTTRHAYAGAECKRTWETKRGRGRAGVDGWSGASERARTSGRQQITRQKGGEEPGPGGN
jgi:hypothetical protein